MTEKDVREAAWGIVTHRKELKEHGPAVAWAGAYLDTVQAPRWADLRPYWSALQDVARGRDRQKKRYASSRYWNTDPHFHGLLAEMTYALCTGQAPDLTLRRMGDGGIDFPDGIDAKGTTYWRDPWLRIPQRDRMAAPRYVLVALDMTRQRGYIVGAASRGAVLTAPLRDMGYGPSHVLSAADLEPVVCTFQPRLSTR